MSFFVASLVKRSQLGSFRVWVAALCLAWISAHAAQAQAPVPAPQDPGHLAPATEPSSITVPAVSEAESREYLTAIDAAVLEHDAGHFVEARAQFLRAHALQPNARTLRGLGMVEFELRNYGESVRYLEQALASEVRPLDEALRAETQALLERARAYVGEVHVAVDPGSASVVVDGVTVASGPEGSFVLVVGDHELEFRARGHLPEKRAVRIRGGDQKSIRVVLSAPTADAAAQTVELGTSGQALSRSEREPLRKKWWLWTAVGLAVVGATVGIALAARPEDEVRDGDPKRTVNDPGQVVSTLWSRP